MPNSPTQRQVTQAEYEAARSKTVLKDKLAPAPASSQGWGGAIGGALASIPLALKDALSAQASRGAEFLKSISNEAIQKDFDKYGRNVFQGAADIAQDRAVGAIDLVSFGLDSTLRAERDRQDILSPKKTIQSEYLFKPLSATANVAKDMFWDSTFKTALQGVVEDGFDPASGEVRLRQASNFERGKAATQAALEVIPILGSFNKLSKFMRGSDLPRSMQSNALDNISKTYTTREVTSGSMLDEMLKQRVGLLDDATPSEHLNVTQWSGLVGDVVRRKGFIDNYVKALDATAKGDAPKALFHEIVANTVSNIDDADAVQIGIRHNMTAPQVSSTLSSLVEDISKDVGRKNQILSAFKAFSDAQVLQRAQLGDVPAQRVVRAMNDVYGAERTANLAKATLGSGGEKTVFVAQKLADAAVGMATGAVVTAQRNAISGTVLNSLRSIASSDVGIRAITKRVFDYAENPVESAKIRGNVIANIADLVQNADPVILDHISNLDKAGLEANIFKNLPGTTQRLFSSNSMDLQGAVVKAIARTEIQPPANALGTFQKFKKALSPVTDFVAENVSQFIDQTRPSTYGIEGGAVGAIKTAAGSITNLKDFNSTVDGVTGVVTALNRQYEFMLRKHIFMAEVRRNAPKFGYKNLTELNQFIEASDKIPDNLRSVFANAESEAMKFTLSNMPEGGVGGYMLGIYKATGPMSKLLGQTFPRFVTNAWRLTQEFNPANFMEYFNPDFRDALHAGAAGGFKTIEAQKVLERATTGSLMLGMGMLIRNSSMGGSRYNEIVMPKWLDPDQRPINANIFPVVGPYLFMADILTKGARGEALEYTADDFLTNTIGARRISDLQIFNIPDILKAAGDNREGSLTKELGQTAGRFLSMPLAPMGSVREIVAGLEQELHDLQGDKDFVARGTVQRDTSAEPWFGPAMQRIPQLGNYNTEDKSSVFNMPQRMNIFTGKGEVVENPILHQLFGVDPNTSHPMKDYLERLPGIQPNDLVHQYKNPKATQAVARYMGKLLNTKKDGSPVYFEIMKKIESQPTTPDTKAYLLHTEVFQPLREMAQAEVAKTYPLYFYEEEIDGMNLPPNLKSQLKREIALRTQPK